MKISKTRIKEIIKEELGGLGEGDSADRKWASNPSNPEFEGDESNQDAEVRLQQVASSLGGGEDFVAMVREAITNAVSSEGMGWDRALGTMVDALEMLSPMQEADTPDEEEPEEDEEEPLVLGKDGPPSPEKISRQRRQLKHGFEKWRK
jgi:hypothetical protein